MIDLNALSPAHFAKTLKSPGAFTWWYVDLSNDHGEALVLVWSLGLPFLAGSRALPSPSQRPSLHLATYQGGRSDLYLLKELPAEEVRISNTDGSGTWSQSQFTVRTQAGALPMIELEAQVELPVAHCSHPLRLDLSLSGPGIVLPEATAEADHIWSPRTLMAQGRATLSHGGETRCIEGSAYFDGNCATTPLHQQGMESWRWGRASFEDRAVVYYETTPSLHSGGTEETEPARRGHPLHRLERQKKPDQSSGMVMLQKRDGSFLSTEVPLEFSRSQRGHFGLSTTRRVQFRLDGDEYDLHLRDLVDDGPFYQRFCIDADCRTASSARLRGSGIAEYVVPSRVDRPWQRPFVRMKTDQATRKNSPFLPLFTGPERGRSERLARALLGAWKA